MGLFKSWDSKFDKQANFSREQLANEQAFTERMWNQTNDWNLAQWNRENEYNSPSAQMERMAMAGINPNNAAAAIAGNDSASGSFSASVPGSPGTPGAPNPSDDLVGLGQSVIGLGQYLDTGRQNVDADTKGKEAAAEEAKENANVARMNYKDIAQDLKQKVWDYDNLNDERKRQMIAITDKALSERALTDEEKNNAIKEGDKLVKELTLYDETIAKAKEEVKIAQEQVNYWKEQTKVAISEQERNAASVALQKAQESESRASTSLTTAKKKEQDLWNTYESDLNSLGIDPRATGDWKMETGKAVGVNAKRGVGGNSNSKKNNSSDNWHNSQSTDRKSSNSNGHGLSQIGRKISNAHSNMRTRQRTNNHKNPTWH